MTHDATPPPGGATAATTVTDPYDAPNDGDDGGSRASGFTLSPRVRRVAITAFVAVVLIALAAIVPVPYVKLSPGPTTNTLGAINGVSLINIEGRETYPTEGNLNLTTVKVLGGPGQRLDVLSAIGGWLDPDVAVVPEESVFPPGTTREQVREENAEEMALSQNNAAVAALRALDIPVGEYVVVQAIAEGAPSVGKLRAADEVLAIDGTPTPTPDAVVDAITAHEPGDDVEVTVRRDGAERTETVTTTASERGGETVAAIGIVAAADFRLPFTVEIALEDVGGPSAGLMFALGIVDKLTPGPLTGGRFVAGTGTIDPAGNVGPIGGIEQKVVAAREAGATVFLTPAANCEAGKGAAPDGLRLVRVETLDGAMAALEAIETGEGDVPAC
jgi:PDZ domain-containing protein